MSGGGPVETIGGMRPDESRRVFEGRRISVDVADWRDACAGLPLAHMGRGPEDDPWFFAAAFAAGRLARGLLA